MIVSIGPNNSYYKVEQPDTKKYRREEKEEEKLNILNIAMLRPFFILIQHPGSRNI